MLIRALVVIVAAATLAMAPAARADEVSDQARAEFDKGLGAFGIGHYSEAADHYEKAFAIKPDPALLYNAAQAHRLAGNKQRALLLYNNYLRLFGARVKNKDEVNRHIAALKAAIDSEDKARGGAPLTPAPANIGTPADSHPAEPAPTTTPPPATTAPPPATTTAPPPATTTAPPPAETSAPAARPELTAAPPPKQEKPIYKKAWFWGVVGGAVVVVAVGVGLGVGLSGPSDPKATLGTAVVR